MNFAQSTRFGATGWIWFTFIATARAIYIGPWDVSAQPILTEVAQIQLSEDQPLGSIRYIDVNAEGDLLVSDVSAWTAHLFNRSGDFISSLRADPCYPGLEWRVLRAKYVSENRILAVNISGPSFFFDADGACIAAADSEFYPLHDFCTFTGSNYIYGIGKNGPIPVVKKMTELGQRIKDSQPIPTKFPTIDGYVEQESIICDDDSGELIVVLPSSATIFVYNQQLDFNGATLHHFPGQKLPSRDVDMERAGNPFAGLRQLFGQQTTLVSFAAPLGAGKFLMQHRRYPEWVVQIFEGESVVYEEVHQKGLDSATKHGHIVEIVYGELDQSGFLPNPKVILYELEYQ